MSLRDIMTVIWRRKWLIPLTCAMAFLAVWTVGRPAAPAQGTYSGSVTLTASEQDGLDDGTGERPITFYGFVAAETPEIADKVAADIGEGVYPVSTTDALLSSITVTELAEIDTMTVAFVDQPSEDVALQVLDRFSFHLVEYADGLRLTAYETRLATLDTREVELRQKEADLTSELEALTLEQTDEERQARVSPDLVKEAERQVTLESLAQVLVEADGLRSLSDDEKSPLRVTGPPAVVADPVSAEPLGLQARLVLATLLGGLLGVGLTFVLHRFDTRLFNRKNTEAAFNLPVLAEVPRIRWFRRRGFQLVTSADPNARASDAYRLLRSSIARFHRLQAAHTGEALDGTGMVILVASASEGVGKSNTVANLAVAAVNAGSKAVIVDADLRRPTVEKFFDAELGMGLTDCVDELDRSGIDQVDLDRYLVSTNVEGATLFRSGHPVPNPGERLAAARPIVEALRRRFDTVIIDSPAMLAGNDVNEIVPYVDSMLLVAKVGVTTLEEAQWSRETTERLQAPVCGVALIGVTSGLQRRSSYTRKPSLLSRLLSKRMLLKRLVPSSTSDRTAPTADDAETTAGQPTLPFGSDIADGATPTPVPPSRIPAEANTATPPQASVPPSRIPVGADPVSPTPELDSDLDKPLVTAKQIAASENGSEPSGYQESTTSASIPDISDINFGSGPDPVSVDVGVSAPVVEEVKGQPAPMSANVEPEAATEPVKGQPDSVGDEKAVSEPVAESVTDEPDSVGDDNAVSEPVAEPVTDEPAPVSAENVGPETVAEEVKDQPDPVTDDSAVAELVVEGVKDEPDSVGDEKAVSEPVAESVTDEPDSVGDDNAVSEPVAEPVTDDPAPVSADDAVSEPVAEDVTDDPAPVSADDAVSGPVAEDVKDDPAPVSADDAVSGPVAEDVTDDPAPVSDDSAVSEPVAEPVKDDPDPVTDDKVEPPSPVAVIGGDPVDLDLYDEDDLGNGLTRAAAGNNNGAHLDFYDEDDLSDGLTETGWQSEAEKALTNKARKMIPAERAGDGPT